MGKISRLLKNIDRKMWNIFDAISMSKNIAQSTDQINFVIISSPRSGSNLLCGMLGAHPQIICFHELYHPKAMYYGPRNRGKFDFGTVIERDRQPYKFLAKIYNKEHDSESVGFKIFPGHNQRILDFVLKRPDIKKIILKRENLLFTYTSALAARQTKKWQHTANSDTKNEAVKVHVDAKDFIEYVNKNHEFFDYVEKQLIGQKSICKNYCEMISNDKTITDLIEFIGVKSDPNMEITKLHAKQNANKLSDRISNYEELKQKFSNTPYEMYLNEEFDTD